MKRLRHLWRHHRVLLLATGAAGALALFFGVRFLAFLIYWSDPAHRDQTIAGWMTPGYVAQSWDLPRDHVADALSLPKQGARRVTLEDIARDRGIPVQELVNGLADAIAAYRAK